MTDVRSLLESSKTVAVVGASTNGEKAAHRIPQLLIDRGFRVIPVHPSAEEIFGLPVAHSLQEIDGHVDIVDVFRPSEEAADVTRDAVAIGAGAVWLQLGVSSPEAQAIAEEGGVDFVQDLCIGATVNELDISHR